MLKTSISQYDTSAPQIGALAQGAAPVASAGSPAPSSFLPTCSGCLVRETGLCPGFALGKAQSDRGLNPPQVQVFPPRRTILHQREDTEFVPVICSGWASVSTTAPNGRKQIVSFLLSGDLASMNYLFEPCAGRSVEAVSQVSFRRFPRAELRDVVFKNPALLSKLSQGLREERERFDQASLDLGRRSAEARLARLLLNLLERLRRKGIASDSSIDFPLRQQQLADATGLTAVHVCKILSRFRANKLVALSGRRLTFLDTKGLQDLVEWD